MKHAALTFALLSLAACQKAAPPPPEEGQRGGAQGEVLEGTISDAMLPLDVVIQPHAEPVLAGDESAVSGGRAADGGSPTANEATPESPQPADDAVGAEATPDQPSDG